MQRIQLNGTTIKQSVDSSNPNSQSTTTLISADLGAGGITQIQILNAHIVPSNTKIRLDCNGQTLAKSVSSNIPYGEELQNFACPLPLTIELTNGTLSVGTKGEAFVSVTYQGTTSVATTSYSTVCEDSGSQTICKNPLETQIGIFLWFLLFLGSIMFFYKIFKKL